jgi:hypothetical protein
MRCYECESQGTPHPAVGICHNCSIGLCARHGARVKTLVSHHTGKAFAAGVSDRELPEEAERFLCPSCAGAARPRALRKSA